MEDTHPQGGKDDEGENIHEPLPLEAIVQLLQDARGADFNEIANIATRLYRGIVGASFFIPLEGKILQKSILLDEELLRYWNGGDVKDTREEVVLLAQRFYAIMHFDD